MKSKSFLSLFLFTSIVMSSCVSSLYPISDNEKDFIFREELLGHWSDKDMQTQVILDKSDLNKYKVTVIDKKTSGLGGKQITALDTSYFLGFLIQLNGQYFFDCTTDTDHPQFKCIGEEARSSMLPLHFIYKVQIIGNNQLSVSEINIDAMRKYIGKDKNKVKHEQINKDHILLTADAAGLQKNILTNKKAAVFTESDTLTRKM